MECFQNQYAVIHRLETNKLRNVASLFAHLLATGEGTRAWVRVCVWARVGAALSASI